MLIHISKLWRAAYFGGNWTAVNMKDSLATISWEEATTKVHNFHSIAELVFHIHYYIKPVLSVLAGGHLHANDKFSFDLTPINSADEWQKLVNKLLTDSELLAIAMEQFDASRLFEDFAGPAYGSYYRNLHGMIEHTHYHLGQIILIKKIVRESNALK